MSYIFARKEVHPKKTIRPPDCWDPPCPRLLGPTSYIFARKEVCPGKKNKTIRPLTAETHQLHLCT